MLSRLVLAALAAAASAGAANAMDIPVRAKADTAAASETPLTLVSSLFRSTVPAAFTREDASPISSGRPQIDALVRQHAKLNGVPESLVHRIIVRESRYNPRAVGRGGAMGLMQIKTATARAMGYEGGAAGLLDAETNLKFGVKYLAGAWRVADGSQDRAVMHYARGYYYEARRRGVHIAATGPAAAASHRAPREAKSAGRPEPHVAQTSSIRPAPARVAGASEDRPTR